MVTIKCNYVLQLSVTYQTYLQTMRVGFSISKRRISPSWKLVTDALRILWMCL